LANIQSSKRSIRAEAAKNTLNRWKRARLRTSKKKILSFILNKDQQSALAEYKVFSSLVDKAVKSKLVKQNNASRNKSRLTQKINNLKVS